MKNIKQANINIRIKDLFLQWLKITHSMHNLTNQQQQVLALFLYYHFKLKQEVTNEKILWKLVFDYETKRKIKDELEISDQILQNNLTALRKRGVIKDNVILPFFIPEIGADSDNFKIIYNFNIVHE